MINNVNEQIPDWANMHQCFPEKVKLFEKFGIVDMRDPKNNDNLIQFESARVAEHIFRCKQNNVPPTHPLINSPLDKAEIEFIIFNNWVFQSYNQLPTEKEIEENFLKMCNNQEITTELLNFGRAWIDISFFIDEKKEMNNERLQNLFNQNNYKLKNQGFLEYLEITPQLLSKTIMMEEQKECARYERSCYHQLLSKEKVGSVVFRPSSYNRQKKNQIFDYYVLTLKNGENSFCDQLIVYEKGRGWCLTGAKSNKQTGEIFLNPSRIYLPSFFDILIQILTKLSLKLANIKRYNSQQIESIYKDLITKIK